MMMMMIIVIICDNECDNVDDHDTKNDDFFSSQHTISYLPSQTFFFRRVIWGANGHDAQGFTKAQGCGYWPYNSDHNDYL